MEKLCLILKVIFRLFFIFLTFSQTFAFYEEIEDNNMYTHRIELRIDTIEDNAFKYDKIVVNDRDLVKRSRKKLDALNESNLDDMELGYHWKRIKKYLGKIVRAGELYQTEDLVTTHLQNEYGIVRYHRENNDYKGKTIDAAKELEKFIDSALNRKETFFIWSDSLNSTGSLFFETIYNKMFRGEASLRILCRKKSDNSQLVALQSFLAINYIKYDDTRFNKYIGFGFSLPEVDIVGRVLNKKFEPFFQMGANFKLSKAGTVNFDMKSKLFDNNTDETGWLVNRGANIWGVGLGFSL